MPKNLILSSEKHSDLTQRANPGGKQLYFLYIRGYTPKIRMAPRMMEWYKISVNFFPGLRYYFYLCLNPLQRTGIIRTHKMP
jgi:hypothetical protein